MTEGFPSTHPFRYLVWYRTTPDGPEHRMEMAFTSRQDPASIQARRDDITITDVEETN